MSIALRCALAVGVLFVLMLLLALSGCTALGKIHALDMDDRWCAAHPAAPAWRNCR